MAKGKYRRRREAQASRAAAVQPETWKQGDQYVDPRLLRSAGSLLLTKSITGPLRNAPRVGTRNTSPRRRHVSLIQHASQLGAVQGGSPIDRHKPYVYGASKQKLRDPVIARVNEAVADGSLLRHLGGLR